MLRSLPFVSVRQEQRKSAHASPLHFARTDELVDDDLRAVGEITELRFPDDQLIRLRCRVAVLEAEHGVFRQHAIDDLEVRLALFHVLQRYPCSGIPLLAILIVQHGVTMRERSARHILARHAHAVTLVQHRRVRECLPHAPIERLLAFCHRAPLGDYALDTRMQLEMVRHIGHFERKTLDLFERQARIRSIGPMLVRKAAPVDGEWLALLVSHYEVRIYLCYVLGHQPKLGHSCWIQLFPVPETDWLQGMDNFACAIHRFDRFLETRGGRDGAELAGRIDSHRRSGAGDWRLPDSRDIGSSLSSSCTDPDDTRLTRDSAVFDSDVVAAVGEISAGRSAQRGVAAAGDIKESIPTDGCVIRPDAIAEKSEAAGRDIIDACSITLE